MSPLFELKAVDVHFGQTRALTACALSVVADLGLARLEGWLRHRAA